MSGPIVEDLLMLEEGMIIYDSFMKTDAYVIAPVICFLCDNVRASEIANHKGSSAYKFCRMCMVSTDYNSKSPYAYYTHNKTPHNSSQPGCTYYEVPYNEQLTV